MDLGNTSKGERKGGRDRGLPTKILQEFTKMLVLVFKINTNRHLPL